MFTPRPSADRAFPIHLIKKMGLRTLSVKHIWRPLNLESHWDVFAKASRTSGPDGREPKLQLAPGVMLTAPAAARFSPVSELANGHNASNSSR